MTTFEDGPAKGQWLSLKRTPLFLRVTQSFDGKWDALNELSDKARSDEIIYVYKATSEKAQGFACGCNGCHPIVAYRLFPDQPTDEQMRNNAKWAEWCESKRNA